MRRGHQIDTNTTNLFSQEYETKVDISERILSNHINTYFINVTFIGYTDIVITMLDNCPHCLPIISM